MSQYIASDPMTFVTRILTILIIAGFMPFSLLSFFSYQRRRKETDFQKATAQMQMNTSKSVMETFSNGKYMLPVSFATLVCILGITLITFANSLWTVDKAGNLEGNLRNIFLMGAHFLDKDISSGLLGQSLAAFAFAFIGGFLWSAMTIIKRLIANDLPPNVYYSAGLRMMLAITLAVAGSYVLGSDVPAVTNGAALTADSVFKSTLPMISFLAGMFPERFLDFFVNKFKRFMNNEDLNTRVLSLENIEGIGMQHRERLEEIEIDNAQNLANAGLTQLMLETPYESRLLLDWIGQAKLLCLVKDKIDNFRNIGIRTVFDIRILDGSAATIQKMAQAANINPVFLGNIYNEVSEDLGIDTLHTFMINMNTLSDQSQQNNAVSNLATDRTAARPRVNIGSLLGGIPVTSVINSDSGDSGFGGTANPTTLEQPTISGGGNTGGVAIPTSTAANSGGAVTKPPVTQPIVTPAPLAKNPAYTIPDNVSNDIPTGVAIVDLPMETPSPVVPKPFIPISQAGGSHTFPPGHAPLES